MAEPEARVVHRRVATADELPADPPPVPSRQFPDILPPSEPVHFGLVRTAGVEIVIDYANNLPDEQLLEQVAQARASGQRPTLFRRIVLGKEAYSTWERGVIGEQLVHETLAELSAKDPR